jgi:hypothetical protein
MRFFRLLSLAFVFLFSCGDSGNKVVSVSLAEEVALDQSDSTFVIKEGGLHFQVTISADIMSHGTPVLSFHSPSGVYQLQDAVNQIALEISPESRSWQEILSRIEQNALFKIQWLDSTRNFAIYNRILPDGTRYDQMVVSILESKSQRILVTSSPDGEYTDTDVQKMKAIISTIKLLL